MYDELLGKIRQLLDYKGLMPVQVIMVYKELLGEAADTIEELSKPKWIPVTERLPKEIGNYLVVINCPRGRWDEICAFDGEKEWVSIDEYAEIATKWVTHWMPLPQPPKEG